MATLAKAANSALPPRAAALARAHTRLMWAVGPARAALVRADVPPHDQPRALRGLAWRLWWLWAEEQRRG